MNNKKAFFFHFGGEYRYGFNGQEKEADAGSFDYDFGARMYDSRIARWLALDPFFKKCPDYTPYNFADNNPIFYIDKEGETKYVYYIFINEQTGEKLSIKITASEDLMKQTKQVPSYAFGIYTNDYHNEYEWYDINETHTYTIKANGECYESHTTTKGTYRTTTFFDWGQSYVNISTWEPVGGIHWVSNTCNIGGPFRQGDGSVRRENIDLLLSAIQVMGTTLNMGSGGMAIPKAYEEFYLSLEALSILSKSMDRGANVVDQTVSTILEAKALIDANNAQKTTTTSTTNSSTSTSQSATTGNKSSNDSSSNNVIEEYDVIMPEGDTIKHEKSVPIQQQ